MHFGDRVGFVLVIVIAVEAWGMALIWAYKQQKHSRKEVGPTPITDVK